MKNVDIIKEATAKAIKNKTIKTGQDLNTYDGWTKAGYQVKRGAKAKATVALWTKRDGKFIKVKTALFSTAQVTKAIEPEPLKADDPILEINDTEQAQDDAPSQEPDTATNSDSKKANKMLYNEAAEILEVIEAGNIEDAKTKLKDIIYRSSLKTVSRTNDATSRYAAMKRYFKGTKDRNPMLNAPFKGYNFNGNAYNVFIDGHCIVATTEDIGTIAPFDGPQTAYFKIDSMMQTSQCTAVYNLDLNDAIAKAKASGYKTTKQATRENGNLYLYKINDCYVNIALLKKASDIINDGESARVYYTNSKSPIHIITSIGHAVVCPIHYTGGLDDNHIIESGVSAKCAAA